MATDMGALAGALDRLVKAANRDTISQPEFTRLRSQAARTATRVLKLDDADPQLIAAIDRATLTIASLDPTVTGCNVAVVAGLRTMGRLRRTIACTRRARRHKQAADPSTDSPQRSTIDMLPASVDLRRSISNPGGWHPIGPNMVNAICACVQDVRRSAKRRAVSPSMLFVQFGARIIAGNPPLDAALPDAQDVEWGFAGDMASEGHRFAASGALAEPSGVQTSACVRDVDHGQSVSLPFQPTRSDNLTLAELKATLLVGQPFTFLFLASPTSNVDDRPGTNGGSINFDRSGAYFDAKTAMAVGYDDHAQAFIILEPSAVAVHDAKDPLFLSYAYVTNPVLAQDVWTIRTIGCSNH